MALDIGVVPHVEGVDPGLSGWVDDLDGHLLRIGRRGGGEEMEVLPRTLVVGDLVRIDRLDLADVGRGEIDGLIEFALLLAVLGPAHGPGGVIVPDIGDERVRMADRLAGLDELDLVVVRMVHAVPEPAQDTLFAGEDLVAARGPVVAGLGGPPGAAEGSGIVFADVVAVNQVVLEVGVAGDKVHRTAFQEIEQILAALDVEPVLVGIEPAVERTVLGDEDMGVLRDIDEEAPDEGKGLFRVSFIVLAGLGRVAGIIAFEEDVVEADDEVVAEEEGVVDRTESGFKVRAGGLAGAFLVVVVVADDPVAGNARLRHGGLVIPEDTEDVPADVAEGDGDGRGLGGVLLRLGDEVRQRLGGKLGKVLGLHLRVGDGEEVEILRFRRLLQVEVIDAGLGQGPVKFHRTGRIISRIARRRHDVDEFGVLGERQRIDAAGVGGGEMDAVRDNHLGEGLAGPAHGALDLAGLGGCERDHERKEGGKNFFHMDQNLK